MRFITSERLKNEVNQNVGEEMIISKYELVMLIAKRAKQISEKISQEETVINPEDEIIMRKPITEAINELEENKLDIKKEK